MSRIEVNGTTMSEFNGNLIDFGKIEKLTMREAIIRFWPEMQVPSRQRLSNHLQTAHGR